MTERRPTEPADPTVAFRDARDRLLALRGNERAVAEFRFPDVGPRWNWAMDWFDAFARHNQRTGLVVVEEDGPSAELTFDELARRSDQSWSGSTTRACGRATRSSSCWATRSSSGRRCSQ